MLVAVLDRRIYLATLGVLLLPLLLWAGFVVRDWVARRRWLGKTASPLIYRNLDLEWQFEEDGDFTSTAIYELENISDAPLERLPTDDFLWAVQPKEATLRLRVIDDGGKKHVVTESDDSVYYRVLEFLTRGESYVVSFSHQIAPPIQPGEVIRLEMHIHTPATELDAFTEAGTVLGIPANVPIRQARLSCVAPAGYKFELIKTKWVVESITGENVPEEEDRIEPPELSAAATSLNWKINNLKQGLRYWIHYRFRREAMQDLEIFEKSVLSGDPLEE